MNITLEKNAKIVCVKMDIFCYVPKLLVQTIEGKVRGKVGECISETGSLHSHQSATLLVIIAKCNLN